jgi:hypothetical protein
MITWDEPGCLGNIGQIVDVAGIAGEDSCGRFCRFIRPGSSVWSYRFIDDCDGRVRVWDASDGELYDPVAWMWPLPDTDENPTACRVGNAEHREEGING